MPDPDSTIRGRRVTLRPVIPEDGDYLLALARSDPAFTQTLSLAEAADTSEVTALLRGQFDQRMVELGDASVRAGYVAAHHRPPVGAGVVRVGTFVSSQYRATSVGLEAAALFISHLFDARGVRRIEGLMLDDALARIGTGLGRFFTLDATLRDAAFSMGSFRDVHVLSLTRGEWMRRASRFDAWIGYRKVKA